MNKPDRNWIEGETYNKTREALVLAQDKVEELEIKLEKATGADRLTSWDTCANCLGARRVSIPTQEFNELKRKASEYDRIKEP